MNVLVDTAAWSLALRRRRPSGHTVGIEVAELIREGRATIIGPIRQEILSGIREEKQFEILRDLLRAFPDAPLLPDDYEEAASYFNRCRARGVQGSNTDFLICAVAVRRGLSILTADEDFPRFAKLLPIQLHAPRSGTH
jgi:hypothetical protein